MKKPEDSTENLSKCICGKCPVYDDCARSKTEMLYCAREKSECSLDSKKLCICGMCPVFNENDLSGGYFCINNINILEGEKDA